MTEMQSMPRPSHLTLLLLNKFRYLALDLVTELQAACRISHREAARSVRLPLLLAVRPLVNRPGILKARNFLSL